MRWVVRLVVGVLAVASFAVTAYLVVLVMTFASLSRV
jgi:hypothetical protein